ncbi:hypothetical protein [Pelagibius sp. Alg239-R121]|uniref:hypothetical protein n=1 Tax=Pelagibius sp. Alg239-R121 TaxID=2993448 RepID=UPI0024A6BB4E|nr:hypothetical protein [Pelagibius sp. Alg239-R121]
MFPIPIELKSIPARRGFLAAAAFAAAGFSLNVFFSPDSVYAAADATVIEITQTPCQFLEVEGVDHGFSTSKRADCDKINMESGAERVGKAQKLTLKPGKYIFRVSNRNVPYSVGFWLRGDGLANRAMLPSVSGAGLAEGVTKDYEITLKPGEYVYSCPLNPTPDYVLNVEG